MKILNFILFLPVLVLAVGFAKMAQYTAVDAFGDQWGFNIASTFGVLPIIAFYYWVAIKMKKFKGVGQTNG